MTIYYETLTSPSSIACPVCKGILFEKDSDDGVSQLTCQTFACEKFGVEFKYTWQKVVISEEQIVPEIPVNPASDPDNDGDVGPTPVNP